MTVASRVLAALDGRVGAEGIRAGVALVGVVEGHVDFGVAAVDHGVGDAVRDGLLAERWPEVGVEAPAGAAHAGQPVVAARVDGQAADVGVPHVVGGEHRAIGRARHRAGRGRRDEGRRGEHRENHEDTRFHALPALSAVA